jgi:hypothetical protein
VYDCFTALADVVDLIDGLCTPITVGGVAYLSLAPGARRGHGAGYVAVAAGRIDTSMLRDVLAAARPQDPRAAYGPRESARESQGINRSDILGLHTELDLGQSELEVVRVLDGGASDSNPAASPLSLPHDEHGSRPRFVCGR